MSNDDHDRLIRVAANWYGLYNELFVKAQRLTIERDDLLASWRRLDETHRALQADMRVVFDQNNAYYAEIQRARALISWIDGMCLDEADHMEIRAAIDRYWKSAGVVLGGGNE